MWDLNLWEHRMLTMTLLLCSRSMPKNSFTSKFNTISHCWGDILTLLHLGTFFSCILLTAVIFRSLPPKKPTRIYGSATVIISCHIQSVTGSLLSCIPFLAVTLMTDHPYYHLSLWFLKVLTMQALVLLTCYHGFPKEENMRSFLLWGPFREDCFRK